MLLKDFMTLIGGAGEALVYISPIVKVLILNATE